MINIRDKKNCCGCGACVQRCPQKCISLVKDKQGEFLYPKVDREKCTQCGLCEKICPISIKRESRTARSVFAYQIADDEILMNSSSGGFFTRIATAVLENNGVVFGARFDENWQVLIDFTEDVDGLAAFRGSKYVQARTASSYKDCEKFLREGRMVLFSGTPCQIAGLKSFLRKDYRNLIAMDFVCHGVPGPLAWRKYLEDYHGREKISSVSFRDKSSGWKNYGFKVNNKAVKHNDNPYFVAFLKDIGHRPSCSACKFKHWKSGSDLTIGDFWGIDKINPKLDDDRGTSIVALHNSRAIELIPELCSRRELDEELAFRNNPSAYHSSRAHINSDFFLFALRFFRYRTALAMTLSRKAAFRIIRTLYRKFK